MAKLILPPILALGLGAGGFFSSQPSNATGETETSPQPSIATVTAAQHRVDGHGVEWWARRARANGRAMRARARTVRQLRHRWAPTVSYALRLASSVYGVSLGELRSVSFCESTWNPYATNGRYRGLFQLGWAPFGMSPFDPVANALSAAQTVAHDGSWRQWQCKP